MTKKLTFCSMMAVFGILCLILSNIIPTNTIFLYLLSTMFAYIATEEHGVKYGLLTCTVIAFAGYILVVDKVSIISYIIIAAYYPVIKHLIEHIEMARPLKTITKTLYAVIVATVANKLLLVLPYTSLWIYLTGIIIFLIYDKVLEIGIKFYALRLRKYK